MSEVEEYVPAADEPSPFTGKTNTFSAPWAEWEKGQRMKAHHAKQMEEGRDLRSYVPFADFSYDLCGKQERHRKLIREQLLIEEHRPLPLDTPDMFLPGTRNVSLAWLMHTCRQHAKTPEEVMAEVDELKTLDGELVFDQPFYLSSWKGWMEITEDVRVRAFVDSNWGKFYDFQVIIAPLSKVIVINKRVGEDGRIAQPVATLQVLDGEALVKFVNKAYFDMHDLYRVMLTFSSSIGHKAR